MKNVKQILNIIAIIASIFFIFNPNSKAEATDYYVGNYSSGYKVYLMTETINIHNGEEAFNCKVKAIKGNDLIYVNYDFRRVGKMAWYYTDSSGNRGSIYPNYDGGHPVPWKIWYVVWRQ